MSYYPVVGDICLYDSTTDGKNYLVLNVWEEEISVRQVIYAHLLCLDTGEYFETYQWPLYPDDWHKVA